MSHPISISPAVMSSVEVCLVELPLALLMLKRADVKFSGDADGD